MVYRRITRPERDESNPFLVNTFSRTVKLYITDYKFAINSFSLLFKLLDFDNSLMLDVNFLANHCNRIL